MKFLIFKFKIIDIWLQQVWIGNGCFGLKNKKWI